jgi:hypothetical protein
MTEQIINNLEKMGLHPGWFEYGFVDQEFIDKAFHNFSENENEHQRIPFFGKFFKDRQTGISDADIEKYLTLVNYEKDLLLKSWATGFLVEADCLTLPQLLKLADQDLCKASDKHMFFLKRRLVDMGHLLP